MPKKQRTIHLSALLWAQIDDLVNYFGDSQNEVLARLLTEWFDEHQDHIAETKGRIDRLEPRIVAIREQAELRALKNTSEVSRGGNRRKDLE
jgi:hypothetical protein